MGEVASIAVAAAARARQRVVNHFCVLHAIGPGDAIEYLPGSPLERRQFDLMRARGIIREAAPGHYWIDLAAHDAAVERRRRRLVPIVIAICVFVAWVLLLFYRG
jgi:hypothetical protein